jgi:hypothetical protein
MAGIGNSQANLNRTSSGIVMNEFGGEQSRNQSIQVKAIAYFMLKNAVGITQRLLLGCADSQQGDFRRTKEASCDSHRSEAYIRVKGERTYAVRAGIVFFAEFRQVKRRQEWNANLASVRMP